MPAVTGATLHVLPTLLRNNASPARGWVALPLLCGGPVLAVAIAYDRATLTWVTATAVTLGFLVVAWEIAALVAGAPRGRMLLASRVGVLLTLRSGATALTRRHRTIAADARPPDEPVRASRTA